MECKKQNETGEEWIGEVGWGVLFLAFSVIVPLVLTGWGEKYDHRQKTQQEERGGICVEPRNDEGIWASIPPERLEPPKAAPPRSYIVVGDSLIPVGGSD